MRVVGGDKIVQVTGLGAHSLFLSFAPPSVFCSVLLPPYAHQLTRLGWTVSPSAPIGIFFVLSFLSLFLASLRADLAVVGWGIYHINKIYKLKYIYVYVCVRVCMCVYLT